MGGGPDKEQLLIALWDPEPVHFTSEVKRRFPNIEINYVQIPSPAVSSWKDALKESANAVPAEAFKSATLLITLTAMPPNKEAAPNLKLIHLFSAGIDSWVDHPIVKDSDIAITTSSGIHGPPITEWIIMTSLVASKHYNLLHQWQVDHVWGPDRRQLGGLTDWVGKRVGIAGYGSIGRQAARVFSALGASIHAYTASPRSTPESRKDAGYWVPGTGDPEGTIPQAWYSGTSKESLHTFLSSGLDALLIALPLTPSTRHLFGKDEFALLGPDSPDKQPQRKDSKQGAFVINIARGPIIDQAALTEALNNDTLSGAALDVADPEPLPKGDPLWEAKNVIITPHVSSLGREYIERAYELWLTNWERHEKGEGLFNLVRRERGY